VTFDTCLKDDHTGDILQWNSVTGDYLFTHCGPGGFTFSGKGTARTVAGVRNLMDMKPDRKLNANFLLGQLTGTATVNILVAPGVYHTYTISQTNPHPTCACT
jgi:hypothetical protein